MTGLSGAGKSTVGRALARFWLMDEFGGVIDRERIEGALPRHVTFGLRNWVCYFALRVVFPGIS